jgi:hypothetical protein
MLEYSEGCSLIVREPIGENGFEKLILTHPSQQFYFISLNINFAKTD